MKDEKMSDLNEIISCYQHALSIEDRAEKIKAKFELKEKLLSSSSREVLNFHYSCLENIGDALIYQTCRAAFADRKDIESFLLEKYSTEKNIHVKADIIHILGRVRSKVALQMALNNVKYIDEYLREVCLYVIGWTGSQRELNVLGEHLMFEATQKLKITAGSALRQISWRLNETKPLVLTILKNAFIKEQDKVVLARIIELMSSIAVKNLGMREDKNDPYVLLGDLDKAILKTKKFIETF